LLSNACNITHPLAPPSLCGGSASVIVGLDGSLERLWICAYNLSDFFAVLEELKGRHSTDSEVLGDIGHLVNIELVEAGVWVCVGEPSSAVVRVCLGRKSEADLLDDLRRNDFARPAPGGKAVEDEESVFIIQSLLPVDLSAQ
jgi:hypothetical protein